MEEKEGIEGVVAEAVIGAAAMVVKWEEGKQFLCPCLVVLHTDCGIDRDCGKSVLFMCARTTVL